MARPKSLIPTVQRAHHIPHDVDEFFRAYYNDPATGKVEHGAMSSLVSRLLRQEMNRIKGEGSTSLQEISKNV